MLSRSKGAPDNVLEPTKRALHYREAQPRQQSTLAKPYCIAPIRRQGRGGCFAAVGGSVFPYSLIIGCAACFYGPVLLLT
jgi:hypothetical protein